MVSRIGRHEHSAVSLRSRLQCCNYNGKLIRKVHTRNTMDRVVHAVNERREIKNYNNASNKEVSCSRIKPRMVSIRSNDVFYLILIELNELYLWLPTQL